MAKSVEFLIMLRMVCLKLFQSLICFEEDADGGWKGGCTIIDSFCIGSIGFKLFTWDIKVLTGHGTNSSVCINGYWSENHLIVKKITNDRN